MIHLTDHGVKLWEQPYHKKCKYANLCDFTWLKFYFQLILYS